MLSYEYPPLGGGGSKVVYGLSQELVRAGHEVDLVTMGFRGLAKNEKLTGVNIFRVPCIRLKESVCSSPEMLTYIAAAIPFVVRLQKQRQYDINHTHFIYPDGLISYAVKKMTGLPFIITAHGSDVPGYNPHRFQWQHKMLFPVWKRITQGSDLIICPSESLRELVTKSNRYTNITVIANGMHLNRFQPDKEKARRILVVTRMFERKGIQFLFGAIAKMNLNYEVVVVGDGPYLETLRLLAVALNIKINFMGWLDNDSPKLRNLYETSRIFVLPSEAENFPVSLLEAMTSGMAIITTTRTGCAEVVGDTGLLVPPKDSNAIKNALERLIGDPGLGEKLGKAARSRLEKHFSWGIVAEQYIEVYKRHSA